MFTAVAPQPSALGNSPVAVFWRSGFNKKATSSPPPHRFHGSVQSLYRRIHAGMLVFSAGIISPFFYYRIFFLNSICFSVSFSLPLRFCRKGLTVLGRYTSGSCIRVAADAWALSFWSHASVHSRLQVWAGSGCFPNRTDLAVVNGEALVCDGVCSSVAYGLCHKQTPVYLHDGRVLVDIDHPTSFTAQG